MITHRSSWPKFSAISGVTTDGRLLMMVRQGTIAAEQVLVFVKHLLRHLRGRLILIWDNLNTHKARSVRELVAVHKARLATEYLPAYAPELNPDEWVWRHLKNVELANFAPYDLHELKTGLRLAVQRIRMRPKLMRSFLKASALSFD